MVAWRGETYKYTADGHIKRPSGRERSDAILGRPIVMNPLHKLAEKLTPVSTVIIMMMRPCLRPLSSISRSTGGESGAIKGGLIGRAGDRSLRLVCTGSIEMTLNSSDMIVLALKEKKMRYETTGLFERHFQFLGGVVTHRASALKVYSNSFGDGIAYRSRAS